MQTKLIACEQFATVSHRQPVPSNDAWHLAAGLEAIAILVLLLLCLGGGRQGPGAEP